jgi:hypothetical protein
MLQGHQKSPLSPEMLISLLNFYFNANAIPRTGETGQGHFLHGSGDPDLSQAGTGRERESFNFAEF